MKYSTSGPFHDPDSDILLNRRQFLHSLAVASLLPLMQPSPLLAANPLSEERRWQTLGLVQQHLLPSEPGSPGASDINALGYLRFVVADPWLKSDTRTFLLQGVDWLEALCLEQADRSFIELDVERCEAMLQQVAATRAGERWLSTQMLFLLEALLVDPAYGANVNEVGWRWLGHVPGFPRPDAKTIYPVLPL